MIKKAWVFLYSNFIFIGDTMYYTRRRERSDSGFYLVELFRYEKGESRLISDEPDINEYSLFESDGKLYYVVRSGERKKLMEYNPKDENIAEVVKCDDFRRDGKIVKGYFSYKDEDWVVRRVKI